MGSAAKFFADVVGEGSDVGAFAAFDEEFYLREFEIEEFYFRDVYEMGLSFDLLSFSSEFIEGGSVYFFCGKHGRDLVLIACECL